MPEERYGVRDEEVDIERVRLAMLAEPGFAMLGPTSIATIGRKPTISEV